MSDNLYNGLKSLLMRPALYERTTGKFWNNPHIAAQMLEAHLNPDTDAASRKPEFIGRCANWIATLLPQDASLLDIGCGPGLYTEQFAERGLRVTGLDFSESSINYARGHDPKNTYILGDYLAMDFENAFDMITLIYYDYGALIPEERHELLRRVHKALKPGGRFLFDVMTPLWSAGRQESTSWELNPTGGFWSPKPHICLNATYHYGDNGEIAEARQTVIIEEQNMRCINVWDCFFTKPSLLDEVMLMGFLEAGLYGDVAGMPYSDDSKTLCAILKKECR
jgi:SAM-dependent methyltransferase